MELINFENFPNTAKPLSAEILNHNFDLMHPVGSIHITSTNENPSSKFGGTWELIDKEFKVSNNYATDTTFFTPTDNWKDSSGTYVIKGSHNIWVRQYVISNVDISDIGINIGTFNFDAIGIKNTFLSMFGQISYSDNANGGIVWAMDYASGVVKQEDIIDVETIQAGAGFYLYMNLQLPASHMLDSACDKFYWKRTA